jgi:hypothetical protein
MADEPSGVDSNAVVRALGLNHPSAPGSHLDFSSAIYGSMVAAASVVGTAATGSTKATAVELLEALLVTSFVFWLLHAYVRMVGVELPLGVPWLRAAKQSAAFELPILIAVVPPTVAVLLGSWNDQPVTSLELWAIAAAIGGQVFWTWVAVRQAHTSRAVTLVSLAVSLALGMVMLALKVWLLH